MKKILVYSLSLAIFLLVGCRDESLNPNKPYEPGVHGFGVFDGVAEAAKANIAANAKTFPLTGQDAAKIDFKIRWVSLDNQLTVSKIVVKVDMIESYTDPDGNPKTISLGSGGKVVKIIELKDATEEEANITEVNPGYYVFKSEWLWPNLEKIKNENAQGEYYLTDLLHLAEKEGVKIENIQIDPIETLGANSKEELEILERFAV